MHLKVIYATPDQNVAKTLNDDLNTDTNPNLVIADQLDISDESLQDLIPSADYVTTQAMSISPNKNLQDAKDFVSQYFSDRYFNITHTKDTHYLTVTQKPDAIKTYTNDVLDLFKKAQTYTKMAQYPVTDINCVDSLISHGYTDNDVSQATDIRFNINALVNVTEYQPLILAFCDSFAGTFSIYEKLSDDFPKVSQNPDEQTWYVFPELISDYHC